MFIRRDVIALQMITEGEQRYVSILKDVCSALDSTVSRKAVDFAYLVPDFRAFTAALLLHEAPISLAGTASSFPLLIANKKSYGMSLSEKAKQESSWRQSFHWEM